MNVDVGVLKETAGKEALSTLPDRLDSALTKTAPGAIDPEAFFLVPSEATEQLLRSVDRHALPYHNYVVETLGEPCALPDCDEHKELARVLPLFPAWQS
jgi:hypothetical protein